MSAGKLLARTVSILLVLSVAGCDGGNDLEPAEDLPITRITVPGIGGFQTQQRLVIRTQSGWEETWNQLVAGRLLPPARPAVDFAREIVVIAATGLKPSTGYEITIQGATASRDEAVVQVRSTTPGNCVVATVITSPVDIVRMPARDRVTFDENVEPLTCG